jgi:uncharacterized protein (DUF342 family)
MAEIYKAEFRVLSQTFDSWNVQFRIEVLELLNQEVLLRHLRGIKRQLSEKSGAPESHLLFDGILRKIRTNEYVDVVVRIKRKSFEKGEPCVHFKDGIAQDGTRYSNMRALLDIYYLDTLEKPIMLDRIERIIREAKVASGLVNLPVVKSRLKEVIDQQKPIRDVEIASGRFSDFGKDAEVEFFFQAVAERGKTDEYYSSRRVRAGDILCKLIPATVGEKGGYNVFGEDLLPRKGQDIELVAETGVVLSFDGTEAISEEDGVVVISRDLQRVKTTQGAKEIPRKIKLRVNTVLRVEGTQVLFLETSKTVEVIGNLCMGSKILTNCDVYVTGDVEEGVLIEAGADVIVEGAIRGASIRSDANVITQGDVSESDIQAKDQLIIKGRVKNSSLLGNEVTACSISNSKVIARIKATLDRVDDDEDDVLSTICVGMSEFFRQRVFDNEKFLRVAKENLARIEIAVGEDIMENVNSNNIQNMLLKVLARNKIGEDMTSKRQASIYRKLLESIPPMREMVKLKEQENMNLQKRFEEGTDTENNMVVIKEKMSSRTVISVNGIEAEVPNVGGPAEIRSDGRENLIVRRGNQEGGA